MRFFLFSLFFLIGNLHGVCPAPGSGIVANASTVTESNCNIVTLANNTPGTEASAAGTINLSDSTIATIGAGSYGAYANGVGTSINLSNVSISTSSANALFLNSGAINFNGGSVIATGNSTNGAQLLGTNALLNMDGVSMQVSGTSGVGLFVQLGGNTAIASNCSISTAANGSRGVDVGLGAGAASSALLNNCTLNILQGAGPPSFGAVVARNGSSVTVQDSTINSEVYGVHSIGGGASILVDNSEINVNANAAVFGAYAQNNTTITLQNNTTVTTNGGNNAHGFVIQDGSTGNVVDSSVQTFGTNAQGLFMIGFTAGNQANISNAAFSTFGTGANAIQTFANAGITNTIQAENTVFSAANDDLIAIGGGITNMNFSNVSANASLGHQLLLVDGSNPATLNWTADSSTLSGDMEVITGNIGNVTLANSIWTGAALDVTNLTVTGSTWNLTANSTITDQLINSGLIDYVSQGDIFKTLTVSGGYVGQNGIIGLNTFLGGDGSPSDLLILNGSPATGSTLLNIKNTTGQGDLTIGNGILVVDAINGGTTTAGAFSLANDVIAGPYEYSLFRGSVDGSEPENWYLRSELLPPIPPVPPIPNFRRETSLYAALPSMVLLYSRTLIDTLHQRVGEEEQLRCKCRSRDFFNGVWARVVNEGGYQRGRNIFHHGPNFHYHFLAVEGGLDLYSKEFCNGNRVHFGVLGALGNGHGKVRHFNHRTAGRNKFDAYTCGLYYTHFGSCGWYIDGVINGNWYRNIKAHSTRDIPRLRTHGTGVAASLEAGYPFKFSCFFLEPQAQIVYQRIRLHDTQDIASSVDFKHTNSTAGRLGLRLANTYCLNKLASGEPRLLTVWLRSSVWNDFQGKSRTYFSSDIGPVGLSSDLGGTWLEGDLGLTVQITDILTFYGILGGNVYLNGYGQAYNAIAGLRANF